MFRFSEDKEKVAEILKQRANVLNSNIYHSSPRSSVMSKSVHSMIQPRKSDTGINESETTIESPVDPLTITPSSETNIVVDASALSAALNTGDGDDGDDFGLAPDDTHV